MNEPPSGGPGDSGHADRPDRPAQAGQAGQADDWAIGDWFRPVRAPESGHVQGKDDHVQESGQERGHGPEGAGHERVRGRHRQGGHRRLDMDQTEALALLQPMAGGERRRGWAGRNWALIIGAVFFIIDTLVMADGFAKPVATGSRILVVVIWLIGVAAVTLLWQRSSPRFSGLSMFSGLPGQRTSVPSGEQSPPDGGEQRPPDGGGPAGSADTVVDGDTVVDADTVSSADTVGSADTVVDGDGIAGSG